MKGVLRELFFLTILPLLTLAWCFFNNMGYAGTILCIYFLSWALVMTACVELGRLIGWLSQNWLIGVTVSVLVSALAWQGDAVQFLL